ncbi:MAG TPA: DUF4234 domain-containing protein [Candidatus Saccharimonadales bacterium]|jgi:hypothetical protein|nr:DUF4234 domain-containing protein [Candidatus Saccharimonadales bacterium]
MKKRNPVAVLLLPIVTLGIYYIYWLYITRKELVSRNGDDRSIPRVTILFLPTLLLVGVAMLMFLLSFSGTSSTIVTALSVLVGSACVLGMLVIPLWWMWKYCQVVIAVTHDSTQLYVLYVVIAWLFGLLPVWMLIVQLSLNKVADAGVAAGQLPPHDFEHPAPTQV